MLGCSDSLVEDPEDKLPWRERKENYLAHLESASQSVCLVSAADKLHNVRSIIRDYREHGDEIWERFQGSRDGTLWYYETVADTLIAPLPLAADARSAGRGRRACSRWPHACQRLGRETRGGTRFLVACSNA